MKVSTRVTTTGGRKFNEAVRDAKSAALKTPTVKVGFFSHSRYPDGLPVATVAAWNEYGTRTRSGATWIPERPFFRQAIENSKPDVKKHVRERVRGNPELGTSLELANEVGAIVAGHIQQRIADFDDPGNAELTIEIKGFDNPLVHTGQMRTSVTWEVRP